MVRCTFFTSLEYQVVAFNAIAAPRHQHCLFMALPVFVFCLLSCVFLLDKQHQRIVSEHQVSLSINYMSHSTSASLSFMLLCPCTFGSSCLSLITLLAYRWINNWCSYTIHVLGKYRAAGAPLPLFSVPASLLSSSSLGLPSFIAIVSNHWLWWMMAVWPLSIQ